MRWYLATWNEKVREVVWSLARKKNRKVWLRRYGKREIAAMHLKLPFFFFLSERL